MSTYITFHNHDTKSLLDSCLKTKDLIKWAKANNMSAVGVTNHGEMSSLLELYKECNKQDIKPILGEEFYVTKNELDKDGKKIRDNYHLIILAKNKTGWYNMIKLHNLSYKNDRYYYDPRITLEDLIKYKEGLLITSACIGGVLGRPWMENNLDEVYNTLFVLQKEFGDDFYLELQNHNAEDLKEREKQHNYNKFLIRLSKEYNIKCVIQNDSHYYLQEDWEAHQVLLCKNTGSKLSKPVFKFDSKEYYLKNEAEMYDTFDSYSLEFVQECFKNTSEIASKIEQFDITNKVYDCPVFGEPEEAFNILKEKTYNGLYKKFTHDFLQEHPEYIERLEYELNTVKQVRYVDYFLMLDDLYTFTSKNNIYMGIGRGSAGGSLVLYCLDVIQVDPIKYHLLFERFINVDRISACDVDCDVNDKDRPKVIEYLKKRYGENHVCNIGTYGEMTAKASFKAVASVLEIPFDKANSLTSIMDSSISLKENYEQIDTFRCACENDDLINKAYKIALVLEGTFAQRGTHACGMVISSKPLDDVCPCVTVKDTKSKERITSTTFEMKEIDGDLKLLKLDILGLRNLGILEEADKFIYKNYGIALNYRNLDINDEKTYKMLSDGFTCGVFQFESPLMQRIIKQVQPKTIEDLSCITALARPSCLESGLTETFIQRRKGNEKVVPILEDVKKYMEDTLQLPIYQENCMQLARVMAGFSGSEADTLRKYIGKKDPQKLKAEREHFVNGAVNLGHSVEQANETFDIIEKFGGYGFNKSHAVGYSLLSYATAYYKANYPVEFLTALLNSVTDDLDKMNLYIGEALRLGIHILPPDINISDEKFVINKNNEIVFGFNAIKGLGKTAVTQIINERKKGKFISLTDFITRTTKVDRSNIQALLRVGAFNSIEQYPKRWDKLCEYLTDGKSSKYYEETKNLEEAIYKVVSNKKARKSDKYLELAQLKRELGSSKQDQLKKQEYTNKQNKVMDIVYENTIKYFLQYTAYKVDERIQNEQELLGFNITTNPYKRWNDLKKYYVPNNDISIIPYVDLNTLIENGSRYLDIPKLHTVGLLTDIKELKTKKGDRMAKITLEYFGVKTSITIFPSQWENDIEFKLQKGNLISVIGKLIEANKQFSAEDFEIRLSNLRQLNVLVNEDIKCIIDMSNRKKEDVLNIVKRFVGQERESNLPVNKIILLEYVRNIEKDGKIVKSKGYDILSGLYWINNAEKLAQML